MLYYAAAFAGGVAVETANFFITLAAMKHSEKSAFAMPLRAVLAALYLGALFFIGSKTEFGGPKLVLWGAIGATVGLAVFTAILLFRIRKKSGE